MNIFFTSLVSLIFVCGCSAAKLRYPDKKPCIMIDMDANITLAMTGKEALKTQSVLDQAAVSSGTCAKEGGSLSSITVSVATGVKGIMTYTFSVGSGSKVQMDISFTFTPDNIFKNNDTGFQTVSDVGNTQLPINTKSYTCTGPRDISFNKVNTTGYAYDLQMTISSIHIQAFNVEGGVFSDAVDCSEIDGVSTVAAVTSEGPTSQPPAQTTAGNDTTPSSNDTTTVESPTTKPPTNESTTVNQPTTEPPTNGSTTIEPTTTKPSDNGTTEVPIVTSPQPTTPSTPKPGSPATNTYSVTGNGTCVLLKAGIEFVVPYVAAGNKTTTKTLGIDPVGDETSFTGNCDAKNDTQTLKVTFYKTSSMEMRFTRTLDKKNYYLSDVAMDIDITKELFPDVETPGKKSVKKSFKTDQFQAGQDGSYKCNADSKLTLENGFELHTYNLQYAAFQTNITEFKSGGITECPGDDETNSVVPIAVGAALAGLVVIVLIAYLIGRKRSRQSGYEQV